MANEECVEGRIGDSAGRNEDQRKAGTPSANTFVSLPICTHF
jgi:hypothetical protein